MDGNCTSRTATIWKKPETCSQRVIGPTQWAFENNRIEYYADTHTHSNTLIWFQSNIIYSIWVAYFFSVLSCSTLSLLSPTLKRSTIVCSLPLEQSTFIINYSCFRRSTVVVLISGLIRYLLTIDFSIYIFFIQLDLKFSHLVTISCSALLVFADWSHCIIQSIQSWHGWAISELYWHWNIEQFSVYTNIWSENVRIFCL